MSRARELGYAIKQLTAKDPEKRVQLMQVLDFSPQDLEKLYVGRLFLTSADVRAAADVCSVSVKDVLKANINDYDANVVHCMSGFKNRDNREMILDLIDAYIDAREALA